jgi:hypothetical protein
MHHRLILAAALLCCSACNQATIQPAPPATPVIQVPGNPPPSGPRHWSADLAGVANMGFADDKAGDGAGGWSDQGWNNSFAEFEHSRRNFGGVPFAVIDPAARGGKAIITFRCETLRQGPESVEAPFPAGARGRYLYLLHTACWAGGGKEDVLGTAAVRDRAGQDAACEIRIGRELADWWNPVSVANGAVIAAKPNQSALVGVYLSRFDLGRTVDAATLRLATTGAAMWIVIGATLTADDLPLPERKPLAIVPGPGWKALPYEDLAVKPGTALDRSAWVDHAPAGSRGRVIARPDGRLAFASDPTTPVRFFGCRGPEWVHDSLETAEPDRFAEGVLRQGYNLVRYHFLDFHLAGQPKWGKKTDATEMAAYDAKAAAGQAFDPAALDLLDRLNASLKRRGIYLYLDAMTSWNGCYPVNPWVKDNGCINLKDGTYGDPIARTHYRQIVTQLLTHRNPYTGLTLAEDPMVAVVLGFNESENNLWANKGWQQGLLAPWRAFLAGRFADPAAWYAAWGRKEAPPASFAVAPIFDLADTWREGPARADVAAFLVGAEQETQDFMIGVIRSAGFAGLVSHFDHLKNLRYYLPRARLGAISMHGYYAHPTAFTRPGSKILQSSALSAALGWWRGIAATRIAGRPHLVTEYGHVYWNRYRYEEGLAVGAYAALQSTDGLFGYAQPVMLAGRTIQSFSIANDPVARASQVVTGLAWRGAAVAPARHGVRIALSRAAALAAAQEAISGDQSRLLLLTGFDVAVEGGPASPPPADLVLPLTGSSKVADTANVSGVIDQPSAQVFAGAVADLRARGLLPAGNRSDPARGIYESDTGEILLEAQAPRLRVATPTLSGLCADEVEEPLEAGDLTLSAASTPLSATIAALDRRPVAQSGRLLLVLATDARNDGEAYEDGDGMAMKRLGTGGVLARTGRFALAVRRDAAAPRLRAWALALDGTRRDEVALAASPAGLRLDLDTAAWTCGPTPFVELAER